MKRQREFGIFYNESFVHEDEFGYDVSSETNPGYNCCILCGKVASRWYECPRCHMVRYCTKRCCSRHSKCHDPVCEILDVICVVEEEDPGVIVVQEDEISKMIACDDWKSYWDPSSLLNPSELCCIWSMSEMLSPILTFVASLRIYSYLEEWKNEFTSVDKKDVLEISFLAIENEFDRWELWKKILFSAFEIKRPIRFNLYGPKLSKIDFKGSEDFSLCFYHKEFDDLNSKYCVAFNPGFSCPGKKRGKKGEKKEKQNIIIHIRLFLGIIFEMFWKKFDAFYDLSFC